MTTFVKGIVYHYNGIHVLCIQDLDPKNLNENPSFYGVVVKSNNNDIPRALRDCFSKIHYSETNETIDNYKHLTEPNTGLWKKWFNNEYNHNYGLQEPTIKPSKSELELWDLQSANGIDK